MNKYYEVLVELRMESESPKGGVKIKKIKERKTNIFELENKI